MSQAVDAASPMETPQGFPQGFGKPHRTRFPTAPTAIIHGYQEKNVEPTRLCQEAQDLYTAERQASRRSDHDDVDAVITMPRND